MEWQAQGNDPLRSMGMENRLPDGSVSWTQPPSRGMGGWEGYCGQTAVANLISAVGQRCVSPTSVSRLAADAGPGSHPSTLIRALERLQPAMFEVTIGRGISSASPRRPIATLLRWDTTTFHWVTVVRATSARVTFNHWGRQESLSAAEFARRWEFGVVATALAASVGQILPKTSIRRR